ncbi:MAG: hypothetical protein OXF56_11010 [Rhodobacteraceae bacterium]|nr:hypothetical protein [Paracoccaceae bacterium]
MLTNGIWRCNRLELVGLDNVALDNELDIGSAMIGFLDDPRSHLVALDILSVDEQKLMVGALHVGHHSSKLFEGQGADMLDTPPHKHEEMI